MQSNQELPVNPDQQAPATDEQKDQAIKQYLFQQYVTKYQELSKEINSWPIPANIKQMFLWQWDTAFIWGKELLPTLNFRPQQQPEVVGSTTPEALQAAINNSVVKTKRKYTKKAKAKNGKRKSA